MDTGPESAAADPLIVTGLGRALGAGCDPSPFLKSRKSLKFMGVQDRLAVAAAGEALRSAGVGELGERAGLYLAVGYLPFEREDIDTLLNHSLVDGRFSLTRFAAEGVQSVNPLITFRCLSNMPAFHVSVNFDVQGPYLVTYPGPGQFYLAIEEARAALAEGRVEIALVGGVAHQRNFLVQHHFGRVEPPVPPDRLRDAAGFLVLERPGRAAPRLRLASLAIGYTPHHPFEESVAPAERFEGAALDGEYGAASLPVALCAGALRHRLVARDGLRGASTWEVP